MKKLDPEMFQALQEDADNHPQANLLDKLAAEEDKLFDILRCIRCGDTMVPEIDHVKPFMAGRLLPAKKARCLGCGLLYNPYTNLVESTEWRLL
jgi:hypothetical protein